MKNTMKRTVACMLLVCMLLAVLPFAAFAEDASADANSITYDFTGVATSADEPVDLIKNYDVGDKWQYYYAAKGTFQAYPDCVEYAPTIKDDAMNEAAITGQLPNRFWFVFKLSGIEAGMYTMDFGMIAQEDATSLNANVYVIPATGAPSNNSGLTSKIAKGEIVGTLSSKKDTGTIKNVNISGDDNNEYLLMVDCQLNDAGQIRDTKIQLKSLILTKAQAAPTVTQPATEPSTAPATTEPSDNTGADNGGFPTVAVVIAAVAVVAVVAVVVVISKKKKNSAE